LLPRPQVRWAEKSQARLENGGNLSEA
jgi:hypothetical protein